MTATPAFAQAAVAAPSSRCAAMGRSALRRGLCSLLALAGLQSVLATAADAPVCKSTVYLTFDTGSQSQAELVAQTLRRHKIKATFFMANEKTVNGDYSLDPSWAPYWKARVAEGHAFGTHTFDHVYALRDATEGRIAVKPQFGAQAGQTKVWTPAQYCEEMNRVAARFRQLTGAKIDPLWRAPGGHLTPNLLAAGTACGYAHVAWAPAGFSGDELPSSTYPNAALLSRMLRDLRDGDIVMAHLGIWSRQDPWAPAVLEPLIDGLERKGFCFATLREHPKYRRLFDPTATIGASGSSTSRPEGNGGANSALVAEINGKPAGETAKAAPPAKLSTPARVAADFAKIAPLAPAASSAPATPAAASAVSAASAPATSVSATATPAIPAPSVPPAPSTPAAAEPAKRP